jgi:hypothetical protein
VPYQAAVTRGKNFEIDDWMNARQPGSSKINSKFGKNWKKMLFYFEVHKIPVGYYCTGKEVAIPTKKPKNSRKHTVIA